jgi:peptidoglycan/xylan/chitin deacetylase (PgdA/CDA1 family)
MEKSKYLKCLLIFLNVKAVFLLKMKFTKKLARSVFFPLLTCLKTDGILLSRATKNCVIINFHGITGIRGKRFNNRHLDVNEFEKLLVYLKKKFDIVPLGELFSVHSNKSTPRRKTVSLTFDDGYLNNFTVALPLLKKHQIRATFYIISKSLVDDGYYVWPDIIDLVQREAKENIKLDSFIFTYPGFFCQELNQSLVDFLKSSGKKRDTYVDFLKEKYPSWKNEILQNPELIELIRGNEFKKYSEEPLIDYGSHTHSHYNLEFLNENECLEELTKSKEIIGSSCNNSVESLAFPDGSYSKETIDLAFRTGYKKLVAVEYKFGESNRQPGLLSRFTISNSTTAESNIIRLAQQFDKYGF